MVDFEPNNDVDMIKRSIDGFLEQEIEPLEKKHEDILTPDYRKLRDDGRLKDEVVDIIKTVRRKSGEAGYWAMHMPEDVGGGGMNIVDLVDILQHIYSKGLGLNEHLIENTPGPHPTLLEMDDSLKDEYLYPLIEGKKDGCFALTEGSSGSDALNMSTTAEKDGDEWVIDGSKMWITNSPYADFVQVFAVTDPDAGPGGVSSFLVDADNPGFTVTRVIDTIELDGMHAELDFTNCRVPDTNVIGEVGSGFYTAMEQINYGRARIAARCAGLMEFLLEECVEYANSRTSWDRPIGKRQHVRGMIADIAVWQETVENLALKTAWLIEQGENPIKVSAMAKYYATETLFQAADNAVQVFGGNGLSLDYPLERVFRYARTLRIPEGTSEMQKERIADEVGLGSGIK
ncbi:acyl-CoA dehydrogenase family protein [Natrinema halophilum]|uniref:acyl-CoA dehydrogenase family protein n=1 Tax=Natrinema halophilum TaxID=1699371 RepID=UPI001F30B091|nr:acyl-CoA dehydrogenase family protein [Natrinema halophilum]UHQ96298.1 acyl-CoA dehydrogenase family protein [Natrinema halophilum]